MLEWDTPSTPQPQPGLQTVKPDNVTHPPVHPGAGAPQAEEAGATGLEDLEMGASRQSTMRIPRSMQVVRPRRKSRSRPSSQRRKWAK